MATIGYPCGCSVSSSMYGLHDVMYVNHCPAHAHLSSQSKSLKQMADEIRAAQTFAVESAVEEGAVAWKS